MDLESGDTQELTREQKREARHNRRLDRRGRVGKSAENKKRDLIAYNNRIHAEASANVRENFGVGARRQAQQDRKDEFGVKRDPITGKLTRRIGDTDIPVNRRGYVKTRDDGGMYWWVIVEAFIKGILHFTIGMNILIIIGLMTLYFMGLEGYITSWAYDLTAWRNAEDVIPLGAAAAGTYASQQILKSSGPTAVGGSLRVARKFSSVFIKRILRPPLNFVMNKIVSRIPYLGALFK